MNGIDPPIVSPNFVAKLDTRERSKLRMCLRAFISLKRLTITAC